MNLEFNLKWKIRDKDLEWIGKENGLTVDYGLWKYDRKREGSSLTLKSVG